MINNFKKPDLNASRYREKRLGILNKETINEDDIKTVSEQAKVSIDDAKAAVIDAKGDLAGAILSLQK